MEITRQSGFSRTILADRMRNQGTDPLEKDDGGGRFLRTSPQLFITWGRGLEDFRGDHLIFERTKGGISRN